MTKKEIQEKKDREKRIEERDKEYVWADVILTSFTQNILYDYPIPDAYRVNERTKKVIEKLIKEKKISKKIYEALVDITYSPRDEYSILENYMEWNDRFGSEWFYGYGSLYRWRQFEANMAWNRIRKYILRENREFVDIIQEAIHLKFDKVKSFELDKVVLYDI